MEEKVFFAAANSGKGFANFYPLVFGKEKIERRYLIKGGPGTGKSTFMRECASRARESGLDVEYYRCSSDPNSLDAIIIAGRIALMDATSPHCVEAEIAGARDEIIDLGAFWDSEGLRGEVERIERLGEEKKKCYRSAYRFLEAAMSLDELSRELVGRFFERKKMQKAVQRLMKRIPAGDGYELKVGIRDSIGMVGRRTLDTYEKTAKHVYFINDFYKSGALFLDMIAHAAMQNKNKITVSYCPLSPTYLDAVTFEESGVAFVLSDKNGDGKSKVKEGVCDYNIINMKRFVSQGAADIDKKEIKRIKNEYKTSTRFCEALISSAVSSLHSAGEYHFELEGVYKKYMDFSAQSEFSKDFAERVVSYALRRDK